MFFYKLATAIILTLGGKKRGRFIAWCNPTEGHHASRLNNVSPMPCQTFSRRWAARQPLQPHSMKHLSLCMVRNSLFDPDTTPQIPQRWHSYRRLYVSWMFTSSLYLVSGEACVYRCGWLTLLLCLPWFTWINNTDCGLRPWSNCTSDLIAYQRWYEALQIKIMWNDTDSRQGRVYIITI